MLGRDETNAGGTAAQALDTLPVQTAPVNWFSHGTMYSQLQAQLEHNAPLLVLVGGLL